MNSSATVYTVDLGEENHFSSSSDLLLTLRASIQVLLSPDDASCRDATGLKKALIARAIWVDQPAELKLVLRIIADPSLSHPLPPSVSAIEESLCRSKVHTTRSWGDSCLYRIQAWMELGLVPLFESRDVHGGRTEPTLFQLRLGLRRSLQSHLPRKPLRLPTAIRRIASEAGPPPGISVVQLSALHVSLEYRRTNPLSLPHQGFPVCDSPYLYTEFRHIGPNSITPTCHTRSRKEEAASRSAWATSLAGCEPSFLDGLCYMDEGNIHHTRLLDDSSTALLPTEPIIQCGEFISLFSCGFKTLFAGSSGGESRSLRSLSHVAPQIFSLGYREVSIPMVTI